MGKNKISLKKNKSGMSSLVINTKFAKQIENAPIVADSKRGWINFGKKNDYPTLLSNLYYNSIVHKSCVDFAVSTILGDGIDYEKMNLNESQIYPNSSQTWDDFIKNISLDYMLYNSFAFQIIKNKDNRTYSFYNQPYTTVRCSLADEDGKIQTYWISNDWSDLNKNKPIEIKSFNFLDGEEIKSGKPYLYVYTTYSPDINYYQLPRYAGALKAIQIEEELIKYDLRAVKNNFSANGFVTLPRIESDQERQELLTNIKNSFVGADNANSLIITFTDNIDGELPIKFVKIDKDTEDVNLFSENNDRNIDRIVTAHRIPSKALLGMPTDTASLGGDGNLLNVSYNLYNLTVANENRNTIVNTINKMFAMNGVDTKLILKPLSFNLTNVNNVENDVNTVQKEYINDIDKNNIEEKATNRNE